MTGIDKLILANIPAKPKECNYTNFCSVKPVDMNKAKQLYVEATLKSPGIITHTTALPTSCC